MKKLVKTLCLLMFVTIYTFSIKCQNVNAYYNENIVGLDVKCDGNLTSNGHTASRMLTYNSDCTNNKRGVFLVMSANSFYDLMGDYYYNYCFDARDKVQSNIYLYITNNGYQYGLEYKGESGYTGDDDAQPYIQNGWASEFEQWALYELGLRGFTAYKIYAYGGVVEGLHSSVEFMQDIDYVNSWEDAKKYIFDGDNSVINHGNPENPVVTQDNSLPVPQSLTCELHNSYTASNPYIEGSWENPKNASWDAIKNEVKIHIQYKPKFQFYKRFLSVKDGQRTANQFIELGVERNENKNIWINAFPNTPNVNDNIIKFETLQQDMLDVSRMVGAGEIYYSGGATLLNGTKWRVRYEMPDGRVSYWAVYGVNSIGDLKSSDKVTFQDNEDNVVSSDAVNYKNSWQTDANNYNPETINNSLLSRLRQALNDLESLPNDMETVASEGSSFANFLQKVWEKFPEIYIIFIGGLIIAIILRILGR